MMDPTIEQNLLAKANLIPKKLGGTYVKKYNMPAQNRIPVKDWTKNFSP